ncbi:DUF6869 domain-containing protein [Thioclava sp. GXIMD2076]|uniref:DUF6869 domain-containing protein n=1 Tax=Thioclava sp. GXIMD2076 TaxID=3131931 RepID=UPI0030CF4C9A
MTTPLPPDLVTRLCEAATAPDDIVTLEALLACWLEDLRKPLAETEEASWAELCVFELTDYPEHILQFIELALPRLSAPAEAVMLAAGPLEDVINAHGLLVIERLEALAVQSPRLCFVLTGVEFAETADAAQSHVIERIASLRAEAMAQGLTKGGPLPPPDPRPV